MELHEYPSFFSRFYDVIYQDLRNQVDHQYFLEQIRKCNGKVLEIGVGTGRLFIDAWQQGNDIYGIDISESMLEVLREKLPSSDHYRVSNQNMTDFSFHFKFDLIVAPFRVFMHVLEKENQLLALNHIYRYLKRGGRLIVDAFVPDLYLLLEPLTRFKDFDGEYKSGQQLKRFVSTSPELLRQLIHVTFDLEWQDGESLKKERWQVPLRYFFRYELEHLLDRSEFSSYHIYGDYQGGELDESSSEFLVECHR